MKAYLGGILFVGILILTGCGSSENNDSVVTLTDNQLDTQQVTANLTATLPDGSESIPLNEDITLNSNVKVLDQTDVDNMTIVQDQTDDTQFIITIEESANRDLTTTTTDYNIGDILMIAKDVIIDSTNPLNFGYKVISKNGSQIIVKAVSNICEALVDGTLSNNPKTLAPFQQNSTITYEKFNGNIEYGATLKYNLEYEIIPTITIQCRNSELYYMNAGIAGSINLITSLFDASSYESSEVEIPLALTQINIGQAKIGLFLEFRPSIKIEQNLYNSPKFTLNKEFSFLRTYINGSWSDKEYTENYLSDTNLTFAGIKQSPDVPTVAIMLNTKFYIGLGGKVTGKGAEAGMSATIIPTFALKDKDNCKIIDNDMDATLEVGFDTILGGYAYAPDYLSWKLYDDIEINKFSCTTTEDDPFISETIIHNGLTYKTIKSPTNGKIWLDRNLGASKVCDNDSDTLCYGDYFQWGRIADGHEKIDSKTDSLKLALTNYVDENANWFVLDSFDWTNADQNGSIREEYWSSTDGNYLCPKGFRVPTIEEFEAITDEIDFYHFPYQGTRNKTTGNLEFNDEVTNLWTTTAGDFTGTRYFFGIKKEDHSTWKYDTNSLPSGKAIRCISN